MSGRQKRVTVPRKDLRLTKAWDYSTCGVSIRVTFVQHLHEIHTIPRNPRRQLKLFDTRQGVSLGYLELVHNQSLSPGPDRTELQAARSTLHPS